MSFPSRRWSSAMALAKAFSASLRVSPRAAFTTCSAWSRVSDNGGFAGLAHHRGDVLEQPVQLLERGQGHVEDGDLLLQLDRDAERRREEDDGGVGGLEELAQLAQPAYHRPVAEPGVEVLEHHERGLVELLDGEEDVARLAGVLVAAAEARGAAAALALQATHHRPVVERLAVGVGQLLQQGVHPLFFPGHQVHQRVPGADEGVQVSNEPRAIVCRGRCDRFWRGGGGHCPPV